MVIARAVQEDHAEFVLVGDLKAHDLRPKLRRTFDVADLVHEVTQLANLDRGRFFRGGSIGHVELSLSDVTPRGETQFERA